MKMIVVTAAGCPVYAYPTALFGSPRKTHGFWALYKDIPGCTHYLDQRFHPNCDRIVLSIEGMWKLHPRLLAKTSFKIVVLDEAVQNVIAGFCAETNGDKLWLSLTCLIWFLQNAEIVLICGQVTMSFI